MVTKKKHAAFKLMVLIGIAVAVAGCKPPGPKALLDGKRLLEKGRTAEAIERLQVATDLMRTNAQAWNYLGVAYHQSGQSVNASNAYRRALLISSDLMEARLNLGTLFLETGRPAEAKSEFNTYTLSRPNVAEGFQRLATAELQLRELAQADLHIQRALKLDDGNAESLNILGMIQRQRGRPLDAAQSFTAALRKRPNYAAAMLNLAIVYHQLGDRATALKLYRQYVVFTPRPADADAVMEIIRQLLAELTPLPAPPAVTPAVAPPPVTTPPTTQMAVAKPMPTNLVVSRTAPAPVAKAEPPVVKPVAVPAPAPSQVRQPPTVVSLPPEPVIKSVPTAETAVAVSKPVEPKPTETVPVELPPATVAQKTEKRGFFHSINPVNIFRGSKQGVTPLPPAQVSTPTEPVTTPTVPAAPKEVAEAAAKPSPAPVQIAMPSSGGFPRYPYAGAGSIAAGDRAKAESLAAKGSEALRTKRFQEAAAAFRAATEADPSWFQAQLNYSAAALQGGQVMESLRAGETALALKSDSVDARYNFALALKRGGYVVDAAIELERLLIASPDMVEAHVMLGNIYADQLRQPDKARAHYLRVLQLKPAHPQSTAIRFWLKANPQ